MFKGCAGSQGAHRDEQDIAAALRNPQLVKHGSLIVTKASGLEDNQTPISECVCTGEAARRVERTDN